MRITGGTLFLSFAIFLDSIESISSRATFDELFPGYNGVLPAIDGFEGNIFNYDNFFYCNGNINVIQAHYVTYLARDQVIVGWLWDDNIIPPCSVPGLENEFVVFNTTDPVSDSKWVAISSANFRRLGPLRRYSLVVARDQIAHINNVPRSSTRRILSVHKRACAHANGAANDAEKVGLLRLSRGQTTIRRIINQIKFQYDHAYLDVFHNMINLIQASGSGRRTP